MSQCQRKNVTTRNKQSEAISYEANMHDNRQNKNLSAGCFFLDVLASEKISKKANMHKYESMLVESVTTGNKQSQQTK